MQSRLNHFDLKSNSTCKICMYVCMYVCMHACMHACKTNQQYIWHVDLFRMYYALVYYWALFKQFCKYQLVYIYIYIYIYMYRFGSHWIKLITFNNYWSRKSKKTFCRSQWWINKKPHRGTWKIHKICRNDLWTCICLEKLFWGL